MQSHELRDRFLAFFAARGHAVVPSDALIPSGDPTVLFTSAGMNQFKDYFLGTRTDLTRAASCQKCLRTGDLEQVGTSAHHHTFFEMLGNFSFGDYFKPEAIQWAWEFLTQGIRLPDNRLWATVFEDDEEAEAIWRTRIKLPARRIARLGEGDNFWPANARTQGPDGPCGPCSEIHFDRHGKCLRGNADCNPGCGCGRFVEVWNLVFTQFDRQSDGSLKPLPRPNIDTGMGLERLTAVVQGVKTSYETDLFAPIMAEISKHFLAGLNVLDPKDRSTAQLIADHVRAVVFLLAEGLIPSNEGRGYVLRMLVRRGHWNADRLFPRRGGKPKPWLSGLARPVIEIYKGAYPELAQKQQFIFEVLGDEELDFIKTLQAGNQQIAAEIDRLKAQGSQLISGDFAFKMKDTHGYPFELLSSVAEQEGFKIDASIYEQRLAEQRERSRAASQFGQGVFLPATLKLDQDVKVEFIGYEALEGDTVIKGLWKQGAWAQEAREGDEIGVVLERSPFYGEAGGQIGDRGVIEAPRGGLEVVETKWVDTLLVHSARVRQGAVAVNQPVRAKVDAQRRLQVARSHTAAHLLHWALRKVLGPETVQAGSLVEVERVRFDFSSLGGLRDEQRTQVEQLVNARILSADPVNTAVMNVEAAKRAGALALFGEKYGRQVRVVSIGDYSKELCGGTHVAQTSLVGAFQITAESSIAAGTRRVEAVVGESAVARQQQDSQLLKRAAERLSRSPQDVVGGIDELLAQLRTAEKQAKTLKLELARHRAKQLALEAKSVNGTKVVIARCDGADRELLSALADAVQGQLTAGVTLLVSADAPASVAWVMAVTPDLVTRGLHAGRLLKTIAAITQGGGGGRADFAQAGGKDASRIPEALAQAERLLRDALA